jgi:hypothetical protein
MIDGSLVASLTSSLARPLRSLPPTEGSRYRRTAWGQRSRCRAGRFSGSVRSRAVLLAVGACSVATGIAACGGGGSSDNGVAAKSPDAIVAAVRQATSSVKSVHVSGSVTSGGMPITLDLALLAGKGGTGQMSLNGVSFRMIVINQTVYINGNDAFWRKAGATGGMVQLLRGKWFRGPVGGQFQGVAQVAYLHTLFGSLLSNLGTLAKGARSTIAGQPVIAVKDTTKGGTLYVATTGKPYPVQVSGTSGGRAVRVEFDRYNQPVSLSAPANSIDAAQLPSG